ncbi:DUF2937 family protein [Terrarubrum flagellatum]|uniref:DUF2937 family protein n=1 Tax=Terrirubrum flagellatum TaxID=2895980 RepID=UPI00314527DF
MLARTLGMALGLMTAILFSQLPEYAQQYRQRLGGAIDELRRVVGSFERDARNSGLTRSDALDRMAKSNDELQKRQSTSIAGHIGRLENLEAERDALREAGPFQRLGIFISQSDSELARRTLDDFEPAVPTTAEGAVAAGGGFLAGWGLTRIFGRMFRRRRRLGWRAN